MFGHTSENGGASRCAFSVATSIGPPLNGSSPPDSISNSVMPSA